MTLSVDADALRLQQVVAGRFVVDREIGRGGMGVVFLARDLSLSRPVAIKLLPADATEDEERRARFMREVRTAAALSHPNIVPIYSVEDAGDVVFFVMAFVEGETLGQRVERSGPVSVDEATRVVRKVAQALAYAHGRGVIHRDVKPDNILLEHATGRVLVTDFGIARVDDGGALTSTGIMVGTPMYVSPEQAEGRDVDGRSDLYSLGVVAHFALTGHPPFEGANPLAVVTKHLTAAAPGIRTVRADTPDALARVVDRCLAKDPTQRWQSGEALVEALGPEGGAAQVPPQVRALRRLIVNAGVGIAFAALPVVLAVIALLDNQAMLTSFLSQWGAEVAIVVVGLPMSFGLRIRAYLKSGFSFEDLRGALTTNERSRREEYQAQVRTSGFDAGRSETVLRWLWRVTALVLLSGVFFLPPSSKGFARWFSSVFVLLMFNVALRARSRRLEKAKTTGASPGLYQWWVGLWTTPTAERLFRICGWGLKKKAGAVPSARPLELAIARGATDVLARLPRSVRARLKSVPDVLRRLEAEAEGLRRRQATLDDAKRALAGAHAAADAPGSSDAMGSRHAGALAELEETRAEVDARLERVTEALEMVRLKLLCLQVGLVTTDDLASDLEAAHRVAREIGAELAGKREASAMVAARSPMSAG